MPESVSFFSDSETGGNLYCMPQSYIVDPVYAPAGADSQSGDKSPAPVREDGATQSKTGDADS